VAAAVLVLLQWWDLQLLHMLQEVLLQHSDLLQTAVEQ
jgi:hypothetical protein